jgi:DNA-binding CsgD family transcriptional regulator
LDADVPPAVRAAALADRASLDAVQNSHGKVDEALEALGIARDLDDSGLVLRALTACAGIHAFDAAAADAYFTEAIDLARALGDRWRLSHILGWRAYSLMTGGGDPVAAQAAATEGRDVADSIGDGYSSRMCRWAIAMAKFIVGDLGGAVAEYRELAADSEATHDTTWHLSSLVALGQMLGRYGEREAAQAAGLAAVEMAADLGEFNQGFAYAALSVAHLSAGDIERSAHAAECAWKLLSVQPELVSVHVIPLAQVAIARGDLDTARRWADDAIKTSPGMHRMMALAIRAGVAIVQNDMGQAERDAHESLSIAVDINALVVVPDLLESLGVLAAGKGDPTEATRLFGAADAARGRTHYVRYKIYEDTYEVGLSSLREALGDKEFEKAWSEGAALSTDEAVAYAQRGRGERKRPDTGWESLTPAELNVVRLAGDGLSNKDIAEHLFLSPRTVQAHLSNVYSKLGITSRVQLAKEAMRQTSQGTAK